MVIGAMRYFDYANHESVKKIVSIYLRDGYPFEPHLSGVLSDLQDLKTMRNAAAHVTSTTQKALDALSIRLLGKPGSGTRLYQLLTASTDQGASTIYNEYKKRLSAAAELIATG
jgi:hypothetical protein